MGPLTQRQYSGAPFWSLSLSLKDSRSFFRALLEVPIKRRVAVRKASEKPILVASDAQADTEPSGGFLMVEPASSTQLGGLDNILP